MLTFSFTISPVVTCREFRNCMRVFLSLILNPERSILSLSSVPSCHSNLLPGTGAANSRGESFRLVEKVMSSAYREYVHLWILARRARRASSKCPTRFDITGEHGLPWGSSFSWHAICAMIVATLV